MALLFSTKRALQFEEQLMPAGLELTMPLPADIATFSVKVGSGMVVVVVVVDVVEFPAVDDVVPTIVEDEPKGMFDSVELAPEPPPQADNISPAVNAATDKLAYDFFIKKFFMLGALVRLVIQ